MAEYLIVVEGLMADGSDAAMVVGEPDYLAAVLGVAFDEPVAGYVWCSRHGWQRSDETRVCPECEWEARGWKRPGAGHPCPTCGAPDAGRCLCYYDAYPLW